MIQYNENNLPILKFLKWHRPLMEHPEFIKARQRIKTERSVKKFFTESPYPFLWPSFIPTKRPDIIINANDAIMGLNRIWPDFAEAASERIEAVSKTFVKAMESSYGTFLTVELFKEIANKDLKGTLIFPGGEVICYDFIIDDVKEVNGQLRYSIEGNAIRLLNGSNIVCDMFEDTDTEGNYTGTFSWHDFEKLEWHIPMPTKMEEGTVGEMLQNSNTLCEITEGTNENVMGMFDCIVVYHLFKKYAPIDKLISNRERREHSDIPEIRTTQRINFLDCSWYTTIIRTEGFNVRGHFRLQPCGEGRKDKKLIYIHEFQKHGYTRRARLILNETKDAQ